MNDESMLEQIILDARILYPNLSKLALALEKVTFYLHNKYWNRTIVQMNLQSSWFSNIGDLL